MENLPVVRLGLMAVSRDCFPAELSRKRRALVAAECTRRDTTIVELETLVERDADVLTALKEIQDKRVNALVLYLGNFGPEGPTTLLASKFDGPVMLAAAAEERGDDLFAGRGDAYCGLLSASYSVGLRGLSVHLPSSPVGTPPEVATMIADFLPVARVVLGIRKLKVITFGPRPYDFLTCHAPLKPLYRLGVEVMENSELDMYDAFLAARGDARIPVIVQEMSGELGHGNTYPELLEKLAQFEIALLDFREKHLGASSYVVFANKCWPAFEKYFGFVPCFINSRLATRGIPISCEADVYGALSEYIATCATGLPATLLDINNTVPRDIYDQAGQEVKRYRPDDLFMGFHCGNTSSSCILSGAMKHQLIMHRLMEPGKDPDITRGTLEGQIRPGAMTLFRLQSTVDAELRAYVAEGEILNINPRSFVPPSARCANRERHFASAHRPFRSSAHPAPPENHRLRRSTSRRHERANRCEDNPRRCA